MSEENQDIISAVQHPGEAHVEDNVGQRLNWLRAGVLGANDGIVSVAGVVVGVAAASPGNLAAIATAGIAALVAGAFSMAGGEYVSVSTQRDTERALIAKEKRELREQPEEELEELAGLYRQRGLSAELAKQVAQELTAHDALAAHAEVELGIDPDELTSPWHAALSSFIAFTVGALIPLAMILLPVGSEILNTALAVVLGLLLTGWISARLGGAPLPPAILRNVLMGSATMAATYLIGLLFGVAVS
ncbi:VIT1/CCC1 transporter family protein [Glutamicibacter protophormiae]|uniref:VIT1/CCC1 family predicted Fe2+/Mn2+ transporter n=1 Tax=Glutamicibacter protophormiae TaxID=37930 RepID=A0ABS4XTR4_GLUPR|nr:VIT family protein [Glutamicibacter protophormiae]MBP2399133.1 VIT1/CCC1 family predicted Fe2+/Mn2+ transporter [Glutamicibacter protophormiae]GGL90809.1 membrane protein [Glutamicibacter protophormiae]